MHPQVLEEYKVFAQLSGARELVDYVSALQQEFHSAGWNGVQRKIIEVQEGQRTSGGGYASPCDIANAYAELGRKDQAFRWFDIAYQERDPNLLGLKTNTLLDPIRSDPRFNVLVRKVGLPQ